jgi:CheR methyltransferase, SAM binding domain
MDPGGQIAAAIGARPVVQTAGDRLMIRTEFEYLLKRTMGLDVAAIGASAIERAVNERRSACKLTDVQAYLNYVQESETELQELIEAVVVLETWFFRDRDAFVALTRMICEDWLPAHAAGVLRLLSLPCSTGEEPYSMAMALLDAGVPRSRFQIDAVDISERALAVARRAEYRKNSFRRTRKVAQVRDAGCGRTAAELRRSGRSGQRVQSRRQYACTDHRVGNVCGIPTILDRIQYAYFDGVVHLHPLIHQEPKLDCSHEHDEQDWDKQSELDGRRARFTRAPK